MASGTITVDLGTATGTTLFKTLFGSSMALDATSGPSTVWQDPQARSAAKTGAGFGLPGMYLRANMEEVAFNNGSLNTGYVDDASLVINNICDPSTVQYCYGGLGGGTTDPTTFANASAAAARRFIANGTPVKIYEVFNEPDGRVSDSTYFNIFNATAQALHQVDSSILVSGPSFSSPPSNSFWNTFGNTCGNNIGLLTWHRYDTDAADSNATVFAKAKNYQGFTSGTRSGVSGTPAANKPQCIGEYNMNFTGDSEPRMAQIVAAVYNMLALYWGFQGDSLLRYGSVWDWFGDSYFGLIIDPSNNPGGYPGYQVRPVGIAYKAARQYMGGSVVHSSVPSGLGVITCWPTLNGSNWAVMLINQDTSGTTSTVNLSINGSINSSVTRFEVSGANEGGKTTLITSSSLTSVASPSTSIVIISGTIAATPPPTPPPAPPPAPPPTPPPSPPPAPPPAPPPVPPPPPPAPPPAPPPVRSYWQNPGGDGSSGTLGGPSVWVTPIGSQASWGLATDTDTVDLRHGGAVNASLSGGDVVWFGLPTDPLSTFVTAPDAYEHSSGLSATLHVPLNAYPPGPTVGASFGRNSFNVWDTTGNPNATWSFVDINTNSITGGQRVFAAFGETDNPNSDHFGEDQESGNFGYSGIPGMLTTYDFSSTQNPNYPKIQHMLRYLHDPQFLKSGSPDNSDTLGPDRWPQLKQDSQALVPYSGHLAAGTTVGIPASTPMPAGLTTEGQMVFKALQNYGALWRGSIPGGFHLSCAQDVSPTIIANLNKDLPSIVPLLAPLRNQHVGGQSFASSPKNGPGTRLDTGPPLLASSPAPGPAPSPVAVIIGQVTPVFTNYWQALTEEIQNNTDMLFGFVVNSGDPQGSSGVPDLGVINTPAATQIGTTFASIKKGP